ncbi:putative Microtubule-associated serine/threonine-protein kinase 2 [Blattamonas nauphoetae]|uniref:non-specific serine/threonine protein kinase n=1 Tax=Blattamonas nauphoetae TaxID=2049346 RepID=A0ABQ9XIR1_9EUKA|nr:putative Microtubule-associated serine/threonine-protein kinase 2 [Blattamonas nauphoetae]
MLPQKSQQTPEDPIVIDSDNDVGSLLLDVDPVDTLQTLFRDVFSDSQNLSIKSLQQLRQLLRVCSSYDNCNALIKSGLCLAILEKATPSIVTKQSAFLYVHIWKILESFSEYATLSLEPTINKLLPSIVTDTLSVLQKIPRSSVKTKGASALTKPQRSDLYRSFINFTMYETISSMVYGIKTELFQIIESKQADLVAINKDISPTKMPHLQELFVATLKCITLPSISKRGIKFLGMVRNCCRHVEIILALFFRLLSTNEGKIPSFITNNGISTLNTLNIQSHLKTWAHALSIQKDIFVLLVKQHPLMCSDFIEHAVSSLNNLTSFYVYRKDHQEQLYRQLESFWRIVDCYTEMTKENQNVFDWWMNPILILLLIRSGLAEKDSDEAIRAFTLFTKLDEAEVTTLLKHTSLIVIPPPNFPFDLSANMSEPFSNLHDVLHADQGQIYSISYFQLMLPLCLYNRLSTLLEDEESNRATIENYYGFIIKAYGNTNDRYRPLTSTSSPYTTFGILLLYSLIHSERVRKVLVGIIGRFLFNASTFHPIATLSTEEALLDLLLVNAPDIPSSTIVQIDKTLNKAYETGASTKVTSIGNRPQAVDVAQLHEKAMNRLMSNKEGRWRALTELAVVPSGNAALEPEQCEAVLALLDEAGTDDRLFIALNVLSKHTLSEVFLLNNPTFVDRLTAVLRSHAHRTDNVELVMAVFSELVRLQRRERSLEGDVVECVRGLGSALADKRSALFRHHGHVLMSSGEALQTTLDMVGECTQLVQNQQLSDPLPLASIVSPFLSSESTDLSSAVLDFFAALDTATQDTPTPFHALSQPITVLDETHKPTLRLSLADFLFQQWIISLELLTQPHPYSRNQSSFYPTFTQVFTQAERHTQSLLLQAVLEKLDRHLKVFADETCGTQIVTKTRFFESDGEQTEWEREVIDSAIDREQLDGVVNSIIQQETLCSQKQEDGLWHLVQLLFSFYKTLNRLTVYFPEYPYTSEYYTWNRRFRSPLTTIRSAVLNAIRNENTTPENACELCRFFSFIYMLTDPECIQRHDTSEMLLVHALQSTNPMHKILVEELREEGSYDGFTKPIEGKSTMSERIQFTLKTKALKQSPIVVAESDSRTHLSKSPSTAAELRNSTFISFQPLPATRPLNNSHNTPKEPQQTRPNAKTTPPPAPMKQVTQELIDPVTQQATDPSENPSNSPVTEIVPNHEVSSTKNEEESEYEEESVWESEYEEIDEEEEEGPESQQPTMTSQSDASPSNNESGSATVHSVPDQHDNHELDEEEHDDFEEISEEDEEEEENAQEGDISPNSMPQESSDVSHEADPSAKPSGSDGLAFDLLMTHTPRSKTDDEQEQPIDDLNENKTQLKNDDEDKPVQLETIDTTPPQSKISRIDFEHASDYFAGSNPPSTPHSFTSTQEEDGPHSASSLFAAGTPDYIAPEVLEGCAYRSTFTVDWWAVGIIFFELLTGTTPFAGNTKSEVFGNVLTEDVGQIVEKARKELEEEGDGLSDEAVDFLLSILHKDPRERLGTKGSFEVKNHPLFEGVDWGNVMRGEALFVPVVPTLTDENDEKERDTGINNPQASTRKSYTQSISSPPGGLSTSFSSPTTHSSHAQSSTTSTDDDDRDLTAYFKSREERFPTNLIDRSDVDHDLHEAKINRVKMNFERHAAAYKLLRKDLKRRKRGDVMKFKLEMMRTEIEDRPARKSRVSQLVQQKPIPAVVHPFTHKIRIDTVTPFTLSPLTKTLIPVTNSFTNAIRPFIAETLSLSQSRLRHSKFP